MSQSKKYVAYTPADLEASKVEELKLILKDLLPEIKVGDSSETLENKIRQAIKKQERKLISLKGRYPPKWWYRYVLWRYSSEFGSFSEQIDYFLAKTIKMKTRSLSGIVPLSIFTKGVACPFNCVYCPTQEDMPKSYFADEAAVARAIKFNFDPYEQVKGRLIMFYLSGHPISKVELIIQGGTFSCLDKKYRLQFVKKAFEAANLDIEELIKKGKTAKYEAANLNQAQKDNQSAKSRLVGITIETRPDYINEKEIKFLRRLGVTRVELGVQTTDDQILKLVKRGHTTKTTIKATRLLKEAGFKITYHIMPGLPGSSLKKDKAMLKKLFTNSSYKPDNIKFYPTTIAKSSELEKWYKQGQYKPYSSQELAQLIVDFKKKVVPPWVRIQRLVRDLTINDVVISTFPNNFRQIIQSQLKQKKIKCACIRCREIKELRPTFPIRYKITRYRASHGYEYFIEALDKKKYLVGILRLRISEHLIKNKRFFIKDLEKAALIRELHVYGRVADFKGKNRSKSQHKSIGRELIERAARVTRKNKLNKLAVIAGVGVRDYYKKLGFEQVELGYMIKELEYRI